jgi:hypothetical protein
LQIRAIGEGDLEIVSDRNFKGIEDLKLIGTVYSIQNVENKWQGYGGKRIIRVNIIESNMQEYDPRDKQANYLCIIKEGKAEIYAGGPESLENGDTVKLDVKERTMNFITKDGNDIEIKDIWFPYVNFFKYIKEQGYQQL